MNSYENDMLWGSFFSWCDVLFADRRRARTHATHGRFVSKSDKLIGNAIFFCAQSMRWFARFVLLSRVQEEERIQMIAWIFFGNFYSASLLAQSQIA